MMFRTAAQAIEDHPRVNINPGDPDKVLYSPSFDSSGHMELREVGKESLYQYIQSYKESTEFTSFLPALRLVTLLPLLSVRCFMLI